MNRKVQNLMAGTLAAVSILGLAACGQRVDEPPQTSQIQNTPAPSEKIVIKTQTGEKEIPAGVQRITTLENNMNDFLLSLGIAPTATAGNEDAGWAYMQENELLKEQLKDVQKIGNQFEPNMEAILGTNPDVILGTTNYTEQESNLDAIAPTLIFNYIDRDPEGWKNELREIAKIVNAHSKAEEVIQAYDKKVSDLAAEIQDVIGDKTVMVLGVNAKEIRYYPSKSFPILYQELGMNMPKVGPSNPEKSEAIVPQTLLDIDADYIFVLNRDSKAYEDLQQTPIWEEIPAVKENHVYEIEERTWLYGYGPIAFNAIVDQIRNILLG